MSDLIPYKQNEDLVPSYPPLGLFGGLQTSLASIERSLNTLVARREVIERNKTERTAIIEQAETERAAILANMKTELRKIEAAIANDQNYHEARMKLIDYAGQLAVDAQRTGTFDGNTLELIDKFLENLDRMR